MRDVLRRAAVVTASDLALVECDRVLIRAVRLGEIDEATAADRRRFLNAAAALCSSVEVSVIGVSSPLLAKTSSGRRRVALKLTPCSTHNSGQDNRLIHFAAGRHNSI